MAGMSAAARKKVPQPDSGGDFVNPPEFEARKNKQEKEFKLLVPAGMIRDDEDAQEFMEELIGAKALLGPKVKDKHKTREILETDARDVMLKAGGFLTLTYEKNGQTKQRFKDITAPEEGGMLVRPERTAVIFAKVALPILDAIKGREIRERLRPYMHLLKTQGTMDYTSHKGPAFGNENVTVSLDRGLIHPRFDHIDPVPFLELEVDTHEKDEDILRRTVDIIRERYNFEISTTPKEMLLLGNPEMIAAMNHSGKQRPQALPEHGEAVLDHLALATARA